MKVIIASKTKMDSGECVGGIFEDGRNVRLLDSQGHNQPADCKLVIGEIWDIDFIERKNVILPHSEDILVWKCSYTDKRYNTTELARVIKSKCNNRTWSGSISNLFDNKILFTRKGTGYISKNNVPSISVGFWLPDKDLIKISENNKIRYSYENKYITYVGKEEPIDIIPQNTLVRVSLARWWSPDTDVTEERCYLQISGWYI